MLIIDQALKIWVKTTFCLGEDRPLIGNLEWARLTFVENPGMAFGIKFGGDLGKLALSLFRVVAIGFLIYYIIKLLKRNVSAGLLICFSLILAGAIGNMLDSAFYGMIFSNSTYDCGMGPARLFPQNGGYAPFLHGQVVDMFYFPFWRNAQHETVFFQHIFNIADASISIGVASLLLFQRHYFNDMSEKKVEKAKNTKGGEQAC